MKLKRAEEVAKKLGITTETLLDWRELGMPSVKIGKSVFILEDIFIRWVRDLGDMDEKVKQEQLNEDNQDYLLEDRKQKAVGG